MCLRRLVDLGLTSMLQHIIKQQQGEAKRNWEETVSFCNKRKDGPSVLMHEGFLDTLISQTVNATALAVVDMCEGKHKTEAPNSPEEDKAICFGYNEALDDIIQSLKAEVSTLST